MSIVAILDMVLLRVPLIYHVVRYKRGVDATDHQVWYSANRELSGENWGCRIDNHHMVVQMAISCTLGVWTLLRVIEVAGGVMHFQKVFTRATVVVMMSDEMVIVIKHAAVVIMVRWLPKMCL